jgi:hypothetical protein
LLAFGLAAALWWSFRHRRLQNLDLAAMYLGASYSFPHWSQLRVIPPPRQFGLALDRRRTR